MQYGSFRARRYRATRTIFRGVRLWMTGSGWSYAGRAILWDLLTLITLGLALPWRMAALERYKMRHTRFGDLPGAFVGTGGTLFKRGWWLWLLITLPFAVGLFFAAVAAFHASTPFGNNSLSAENVGAIAIGTMLLVLMPVALIGFPFYRAITIRWRLEGVRFGEFFLTSSLRKRSVLWTYVRAMLIGGVVTGVIGIILQVFLESFGFSLEGMTLGKPPPAFAMIGFVVFYILTVFTIAIVMLQIVTRGMWELAVNSVTVFNLEALDMATARGMAAGSLGEGLADALDFGGGIGI
jgi:uncharacterized membrane protein YjgN (DUF898 family)